jgi:acyl-CoA thioester hydrolase
VTVEIDTYRGVVYPWQCDCMGHMNTQFYCGIFDAASFHMLSRLGPYTELAPLGQGWADVKQTIEYRHETRAGALVHVRSVLVRVGNKSVEFRHRMLDSETEALHATSENVTVLFDLEARKAVALSDPIRSRCRELGIPS